MRASATNGRLFALESPAQAVVEVRGRWARVVELLEEPELFAQQEGAVQPRVGLLDVAEFDDVGQGLALGRF